MMKRSKRFAALILTGVMAATTLFGCGSSSGGAASDSSAADSSLKKVLKVQGHTNDSSGDDCVLWNTPDGL